jgi:putative Holliday junction resolvase
MRILGIDFGESKIGLALGETDARIASPFMVIKNDILQILEIIRNEDIQKVVVGVPYTDAYAMTQQAEKVTMFVQQLREATNVEVDTIDERFSTAEAKRLMLDDEIKGEDDAIAAMVILQGYMDRS